jgi:D-sedoheptulose 7-phosphate isomerase
MSDHLDRLVRAITAMAGLDEAMSAWGRHLAGVLMSGGRLLACGNGGSAAQALHLTAELSGRYRADRQPLSAIALSTEAPALTAISNDYGFDHVFARQVRAHGRPGDVLMLLSTSGRSQNLIEAAQAAGEVGTTSWALTGPAPNPLAAACDDVVAIAAEMPATVQELHLAIVHMLCAAVDEALLAGPPHLTSPAHLADSPHLASAEQRDETARQSGSGEVVREITGRRRSGSALSGRTR